MLLPAGLLETTQGLQICNAMEHFLSALIKAILKIRLAPPSWAVNVAVLHL